MIVMRDFNDMRGLVKSHTLCFLPLNRWPVNYGRVDLGVMIFMTRCTIVTRMLCLSTSSDPNTLNFDEFPHLLTNVTSVLIYRYMYIFPTPRSVSYII